MENYWFVFYVFFLFVVCVCGVVRDFFLGMVANSFYFYFCFFFVLFCLFVSFFVLFCFVFVFVPLQPIFCLPFMPGEEESVFFSS